MRPLSILCVIPSVGLSIAAVFARGGMRGPIRR